MQPFDYPGGAGCCVRWLFNAVPISTSPVSAVKDSPAALPLPGPEEVGQ
ncbi:hypothetical protein RY654_003212 [Escherichia coli]|nr:hypothetical protein [Escherichia coli]